MNITELTVHELQEKIKSKEITITQIVEAYCERIKEKETEVKDSEVKRKSRDSMSIVLSGKTYLKRPHNV